MHDPPTVTEAWGGNMRRIRWVSAALGAALAGVMLVPVGPAAADQVLLACNAGSQTAVINPPLGSGSSRYYKSVAKTPGGATCLVDSGISTNNAATNSVSGKDNPYDNQTNGHASLTVLQSVSTTSGSFTCNTTDPANQVLYPWTYPGQGKLVTKFVELDAAGKPLQLQAYIRLGKDFSDPDQYDLVVSGIVIKGVGVGGSVHAVVTLAPDLASTKNLNLIDCVTVPAAGNASLAAMNITPADGSDAGTDVDLWTVSLPD